MQPNRAAGQGDKRPPPPPEPVPTREEEADETRSGRPMPEEDALSRTEHHKGSYGGEEGKPRSQPEQPKKGRESR